MIVKIKNNPHQPPRAKCITCYVLGTLRKNLNIFIICLLQADLSNKDSQIADLQENIKSQQAETSKARDELKGALTAMEQLKDGFKRERADWETEKDALLKQAEDAEAALKPVAEELTGLKRRVNAMTTAIFGKHSSQEPFLTAVKLPD